MQSTGTTDLDSYFNSKSLKKDIKVAFKEYVEFQLLNYFHNHIDDFVNTLPNVSQWLSSKYKDFKSSFVFPNGYEEKFYCFFHTHAIASTKQKSGKLKFDKIKRDHKNKVLLAVKAEEVKLGAVYHSFSLNKVLPLYLKRELKKAADEIDGKTFNNNELDNIRSLKKIDILHKIYQTLSNEINFSNASRKHSYLKEFKEPFIKLQKGSNTAWSTLANAFTNEGSIVPKLLNLPTQHVQTYDFNEFSKFDFIIYCSKLAEDKISISMIETQIEKGIGSTLSIEHLSLLNSAKVNNPQKTKEIIDEVLNEQLYKYSRYIAITSLVSAIDPLLRSIYSELGKKGVDVHIHDFNISTTYEEFKKNYLTVTNPFPGFNDLEFLLNQLYSKKGGALRNSILHLDGVDFTTPHYHFENLKLFVYNIYFQLAQFIKHESIHVSLLEAYNKLNTAELKLIADHKETLTDYVLEEVVLPKILDYANTLKINADPKFLKYFNEPLVDCNFIRNNWDQIYPAHLQNKGFSLKVLIQLKENLCRSNIQNSSNLNTSKQDIIDSLKLYDFAKLLSQAGKVAQPVLEGMVDKMKQVIPAFSSLLSISLNSVRAPHINEGVLTVVMNSILIEKLLLHLKLFFGQNNLINIKGSKQNSNLFYCTFKNLEIAEPSLNSFTDEVFLEKLFRHINNTTTIDRAEYNKYKRALEVFEKIRNISAHGGFIQLKRNSSEINHFLFYLTFRLLGLH